MVLEDLDSYVQKMKLDHQLTPYTQKDSRSIKDSQDSTPENKQPN